MPPPPHVIEAANRSVSNLKNHGYGSYRGLPAYRQAVAAYYQRRFGITLDPESEVLPLIGRAILQLHRRPRERCRPLFLLLGAFRVLMKPRDRLLTRLKQERSRIGVPPLPRIR